MRKIISLGFALLALIIWIYIYMNFHFNKNLVFAVPQLPFSSDPMEYDDYAHHHAFTSVFAKIVSSNKNGEITPALAYKWSNENNFKKWHFYIRKDLSYSNGDKISISDIENNFKRIAYLKKNQNSESGLLEFLVGYSDIKTLGEKIKGIEIDEEKISFEFIKEMPSLLEKISFGFYSLAHPSLYDHKNGKWKDNKKIIASSAYDVEAWTNDKFILSLRPNVLSDHRKIKTIIFKEIKSIKSTDEMKEVDVLMGDQQSTLVDNEFIFNGSTTGLKIGYVECYSWKNESSPLSDINVRKWLRAKFYEGLMTEGFSITRSFFPLALKGVSEVVDQSSPQKPNFRSFTIITSQIPKPALIKGNEHKKPLADIFFSAMKKIGENSGAEISFEKYDHNAHFDFLINGTGIEALEYMDTVRFMFNSKQGIQLPDVTGSIKEELQKKEPNIQKINQLLWDQAIIWPIRHYTSGFWFNKDSGIDYSEINFDSPSIDFQFLKWQ